MSRDTATGGETRRVLGDPVEECRDCGYDELNCRCDDERLTFFPPPEEWSAWLAEPAGTPYPWPEDEEGEADAT